MKKAGSFIAAEGVQKMFSRTRVAALTIAHEEVGYVPELLRLAYSL